MTAERNEVKVNTSWQKALINHFIREVFSNEALRVDIPKFSFEEYRRVLEEFTGPKTNSLQNTIENISCFLPSDKDIILSFLKHYAIKMLSDGELVPIKDHLANHVCIDAMLKVCRHESFEGILRQDV